MQAALGVVPVLTITGAGFIIHRTRKHLNPARLLKEGVDDDNNYGYTAKC